jgi:hypothetical protein
MKREWGRETRKIREAMDVPEEEQKTPRDALSALSAWLKGLFEDEHAHERGEPYCKMCGKEGIESGDFEEEGVDALLCDDCQDKI